MLLCGFLFFYFFGVAIGIRTLPGKQDPRIHGPYFGRFYKIEEVTKCAIIGLLCVQGDPRKRPDIDDVVSMLTGNMDFTQRRIGKPGLLGYNKSSSIDLFSKFLSISLNELLPFAMCCLIRGARSSKVEEKNGSQ